MVGVSDIDIGFIQKLKLLSSPSLYLSFGNYFHNMRVHIGENMRTLILRSYFTFSSPLRNHENNINVLPLLEAISDIHIHRFRTGMPIQSEEFSSDRFSHCANHAGYQWFTELHEMFNKSCQN